MKFLRRFCSEQVQILLERMDNHWVEEFAIDGSKWEPMLPYGKAFEQFTAIEQRCVRSTAREQGVKLRKEQAYTGILERTMSPTKTRWDFDDEKYGRTESVKAQPAQMLTTAAMRQQMDSIMNQYAKNPYKGTLPEHAQIARQQAQFAEADRLRKYMEGVGYELDRAVSVKDMEAVMKKQEFLLEHERKAVEHATFMKQHGPRGYI